MNQEAGNFRILAQEVRRDLARLRWFAGNSNQDVWQLLTWAIIGTEKPGPVRIEFCQRIDALKAEGKSVDEILEILIR